MAGATSLEAVKRKIKLLQEQADVAEDRAERLQQELVAERKTREQVSMFVFGVCLPRVQSRRSAKKNQEKINHVCFRVWFPTLPSIRKTKKKKKKKIRIFL